jgi:membrane-associated phospholipid phosphatase
MKSIATNANGPRIRVSALLPQPDPRSWAAYAILASLASAAYVSLAITGLRFGVPWGQAFSEVAMVVIFVAWMLRRAGHSAISTGLETIALAYLISMVGAVIQYPLMALPFPFADALLSRIDHALGFDWWAFSQLFSNRWLWGAMSVAYDSVIPQTLLLLLLLSSSDRHARAWQFVIASSLAMGATMIVLPFFPADGSLALCSLEPDNPWIAKGVCKYGSIIHQLKEGHLKVLGSSELVGLVSFPSFHTSVGLQFIWGFWPYRWLRWPVAAFNILLVCGAIVIASHYFIDILGGALIGLLAIKVAAILGRVSGSDLNANMKTKPAN